MRLLYLLGIAALVPVLAHVHWISTHTLRCGCRGAADAALAGDQATLDNAISLYRAEHGQYPSLGLFVQQMTMYTSASGEARPTPDLLHDLGFYIRSIPPLPKGPQRGCSGVGAAPGPGVGWIYDEFTGQIRPDLGPVP